MKQFIKKIKSITLALMLLAVPLALTSVQTASAQDCFNGTGNNFKECLEAGSCGDTGGVNAGCGDADQVESKVNSTIKLIINIFSFIVGIVAVIMIIIGGLKYITSSGDAGNVTSAKNTILYAIIGLVVVALAQIIVRFVLEKAAV